MKRVEENQLNSLRAFSHAWLTILMPLTCSLGILYSFFHIDSSPAFPHHILTVTVSLMIETGLSKAKYSFCFAPQTSIAGLWSSPRIWRYTLASLRSLLHYHSRASRLCIPCLIYLCSNLRFPIKSGGPRDSTLRVGLVSLE